MSKYALGCIIVAVMALSAVEPRRNHHVSHKAARYHNKFFGQYDQAEYCRIADEHTMCKYKGVGPKCSRLMGGGVTAADQAAILEAHNKYRQKVAQGSESRGSPGPQPHAANMKELFWDDELARVAQRWADQCDYGHDKKRGVRRFEVAQNVYAWSTTGYADPAAEWLPAIRSLYDEVRLYNGTRISPFEWRTATSHYTQIVWAKTYVIGCGYSMYQKEGQRDWTDKFYVCNYGPQGNIGDGTMYKVGKPCSLCSRGTSCRNRKYPSLCS